MSALRTDTMEFGPLQISYDARVLQPRPWTVAQGEWAAELLVSAPEGPVLELCTGAGQIGLLAVAASRRRLVAVDLNPVACDFARHNAAAAGFADRVEVREGPMDTVLGEEEHFALVIADPPWVRRGDVGRYPEDPLLAIDGGDDGMHVARACVETAWRHVMPGGSMLIQLGTPAQVDLLDDVSVAEVRRYERGVVARVDFT